MNKRILVAVPDGDNLHAIRSALGSAQHVLLEARTGNEAKRLLQEERDISAVVTSFIASSTNCSRRTNDEFSDCWLAGQDTFCPLVRLVPRGYLDEQERLFVKVGVTTLETPFNCDRLKQTLEALLAQNIRPKSFSDLQSQLLTFPLDQKSNKYISQYVYRGLDDAAWRLETKFTRLSSGRSTQQETKLSREEREEAIIRNFKKYADASASHLPSDWHWLSLGQHYGLATRLLDWTYSPLVALHFATKDEEQKKDGVVWAVNYLDAHGREPFRSNGRLPKNVQLSLDEQGGKVFTIETLSVGFPDRRKFDGEGSERPFLLFFEPPSFDQRIVNQFAVFSVASDRDLIVDGWLELSHVDCMRIIIPAGLKPEIRQKLDQCNISERTLFPGLDGICSWLNRHYVPA